MYTLTLSEDERQILMGVLENTISEVHSEIVHCQVHEYKEMLKVRKRLMMNMLAALGKGGDETNQTGER